VVSIGSARIQLCIAYLNWSPLLFAPPGEASS
jgi:hypothetical protein